MTRPLDPRRRQEIRTLVRQLRSVLDDLLAGRTSRAEVARWAIDNHEVTGLFGDALAVLESLGSADEYEDGKPLLGPAEFNAYKLWLSRGEGFYGDDQPLTTLPCSLDVLDGLHASAAVRFWFSGLGWCWERRFISSATGRPFVAFAMNPDGPLSIHKRRGDEAQAALADLREELQASLGARWQDVN